MPFAVSPAPALRLPSPICFAPASNTRVADLTFDSSAAVAGAAIQPIRAASGIATARSLLVVMVGCLLVCFTPPGYRGAVAGGGSGDSAPAGGEVRRQSRQRSEERRVGEECR